jgi:transcriptional regulator with XRE-family HTH domain
MEYMAKQFGKNLRILLLQRNMSVTVLARISKVNAATIRNFIQRNTIPNLETALRITDALGVSVESLTTEKGDSAHV